MYEGLGTLFYLVGTDSEVHVTSDCNLGISVLLKPKNLIGQTYPKGARRASLAPYLRAEVQKSACFKGT